MPIIYSIKAEDKYHGVFRLDFAEDSVHGLTLEFETPIQKTKLKLSGADVAGLVNSLDRAAGLIK